MKKIHRLVSQLSSKFHLYIFSSAKKTTDRGHRLTALTTELLCLRCLCEVKSQYGNVYLWSGLDPLPSSFNQAAVLCLFAISVVLSYHTHRRLERGAHQCLSERRRMGLTHLWEMEKTHKFGATCPFAEGLSLRSWRSALTFTVFWYVVRTFFP